LQQQQRNLDGHVAMVLHMENNITNFTMVMTRMLMAMLLRYCTWKYFTKLTTMMTSAT